MAVNGVTFQVAVEPLELLTEDGRQIVVSGLPLQGAVITLVDP